MKIRGDIEDGSYNSNGCRISNAAVKSATEAAAAVTATESAVAIAAESLVE